MTFTLHRCCCKYDISDGSKLIGIYQIFVFIINVVIIILYKEWVWVWMLLFPLLSFSAMVRAQKKDDVARRRHYYIAMVVQLVLMNVGQLSYLIIDTYEVKNKKKCDGDY